MGRTSESLGRRSVSEQRERPTYPQLGKVVSTLGVLLRMQAMTSRWQLRTLCFHRLAPLKCHQVDWSYGPPLVLAVDLTLQVASYELLAIFCGYEPTEVPSPIMP